MRKKFLPYSISSVWMRLWRREKVFHQLRRVEHERSVRDKLHFKFKLRSNNLRLFTKLNQDTHTALANSLYHDSPRLSAFFIFSFSEKLKGMVLFPMKREQIINNFLLYLELKGMFSYALVPENSLSKFVHNKSP